MNTKVYLLMYRSFAGERLLNCRVLSVHTTMKSALLMLDALKFGYQNNFDDVQQDEKNELKIHITSDTMRAEYEIEPRECI